MVPQVRKLALMGVGLIGGSFALALRRANLVERVVGVDRDARTLDGALALHLIDEAETELSRAVRGADLVLLAVPVRQMASVMKAVANHMERDALITDVGSTKQSVIADARQHLGAHFERFVPAHPIAGSEKSGVNAARADLFDGRSLIVTPVVETLPLALERIKELWLNCGAQPATLTPLAHDEIFARVSHLPHLMAFALMQQAQHHPKADSLFQLAGASFREVTRLAKSSPELWRDIFLANREAVLSSLDEFQHEFDRLRGALQEDDADKLLHVLNADA